MSMRWSWSSHLFCALFCVKYLLQNWHLYTNSKNYIDSLCMLCCCCDFRCSLMFHDFSGGRTLQILNAQEDNAGRYSCVATNEAGEMIKHYEVKVYSKF